MRNVRLYFRSTVIAWWLNLTMNTAIAWEFDIVVLRLGAATQMASGYVWGLTGNGFGRTACTEPISGNVLIKLTGQSSGSAVANDVTYDFLLIEL